MGEGEKIENKLEYTIENQECFKPYKCSYDIRLQNTQTEQELKQIAQEIKLSSPKVERIFISYYLPCMKTGNPSWATSHYNPNLEIMFFKYNLIPNPACLNNTKEL